ncbi:MAG: hypothetical protein F8N37_14570 [Telmatospirillum sp.]|nr:hypothetical protein [Telmatospirillum sp.]
MLPGIGAVVKAHFDMIGREDVKIGPLAGEPAEIVIIHHALFAIDKAVVALAFEGCGAAETSTGGNCPFDRPGALHQREDALRTRQIVLIPGKS